MYILCRYALAFSIITVPAATQEMISISPTASHPFAPARPPSVRSSHPEMTTCATSRQLREINAEHGARWLAAGCGWGFAHLSAHANTGPGNQLGVRSNVQSVCGEDHSSFLHLRVVCP